MNSFIDLPERGKETVSSFSSVKTLFLRSCDNVNLKQKVY